MKWFIAWASAAIIFAVLDAIWLNRAAPLLYRPLLGDLLADSFRPVPAVLFYLCYISAMVWFAIRPGLAEGVPYALLNGALLGGIAYATYDLTNQATLRHWPAQITVIDIVWGMSATALASSLATWITQRWS